MQEIRKIFQFVKPYWKLATLAMLMLLVMVFCDLSVPKLIQRIIDDGVKQNNLTVVLQTSAIMLGISILDTVVAILNNIFSVRTGESVARDIRDQFFTKIQHFSFGDLDRFSTGKLMVRLTSDSSAVQRFVQVSLRIGTRAPLLMIGSIILMFFTSAPLATAMIPILLVTMVIIIFFSIKMEPLFRTVQFKLDRLNTVLQENLAGASLVKAFVRGDYESQRFEVVNEDLTGWTTRVMQLMALLTPGLTFLINIGIVLVIWQGGLNTINGNMMVGQIVAFTNYLLTTMTPLIMMTQLSNTWASGLASFRRIDEVLTTTPEVVFEDDAQILLPDEDGKVDFKEVDFHYKGDGTFEVLRGISLNAEPGEVVAILGSTGAGKSSLINLIPRFYDVTGGEVCVDDRDVRTLSEDSLYSHIGIVPQQTILFSGTIRENICYGKPDATDAEVIEAAKIAQAHEFIMNFPQGYETHVEERGVNLSGGQKQRIAIARAVIMRPRILILDDATSSVDVETETHIQDSLKKIMGNRTNFVVAQRISTVLNADKIVVLDKGTIAAEGRHEELMERSPIYREIYDSQLGNGFHDES